MALLSIGAFGAVVLALFGYVYWSAASYMHSQPDRAILAQHAVLERAYENAGRDGLVAIIAQRVADEGGAGQRYYLLANASFARLAGNLETWPADLSGTAGWKTFTAREAGSDAAQGRLLRARFETLSDGSPHGRTDRIDQCNQSCDHADRPRQTRTPAWDP